MPPRKRKVPEKAIEETVDDSPAEPPQSKTNGKVQRKGKAQKKKSTEVETVVSPQQAKEKHLVLKIITNAQSNEAFHNKYIKELANQYNKVGIRPTKCVEEGISIFVEISTFCFDRSATMIFWRCLFVVWNNWLTQRKPSQPMQILAFTLWPNLQRRWQTNHRRICTNFWKRFSIGCLRYGCFSEIFFFFFGNFDLTFAIPQTVSLSHNVRARLCRFVNLLLDSLGSNASLDDTLFDNILKYMFDRLKVTTLDWNCSTAFFFWHFFFLRICIRQYVCKQLKPYSDYRCLTIPTIRSLKFTRFTWLPIRPDRCGKRF